MKIKHGLLIFAIGAAVNGGAMAADKKETNLQTQAEAFKAGQNTVSRDKLVTDGREITDARSAIRNDEYFDSLKQSAAETKTGRIVTQLDLERNEFILNNVPVHVRVAGEQEVQAYVRKHFIDNEDTTNNTAAVEAKTLWKNTDSSLTAPASMDYGWQPVVREVNSTAQVVNKDPEPISKEPIELDNEDDGEKDSAPQLELTAEDLARLFDNGTSNGPQTKLPEADTEKNVVVNTITVNRVIIAPRAQLADIEVTFTVVHPGGSKKVDKEFKQVSPGHLFEVDGVRFEIAALTRHSIVLTNVETDKSYSQIID